MTKTTRGVLATTTAKPLAKRRRKHTISRKVKVALEAMAFEGLKRDQAAERAGMKDNSLYVALRKPDVKAEYLAMCEVLRTSGRARRIHRLETLSEQDENKQAAVNAIRALDNMDGDGMAAAGATQTVPGMVIVVVDRAPAPPLAHETRGPGQTITINPGEYDRSTPRDESR